MTFKEDGYKIIKDFCPVSNIYKELIDFSDKEPGDFDAQSPNSPAYYGKPKILDTLHRKLIHRLEGITGYKLYKTYFYWRMYYKGAILITHTDRPACEISGTLFLGGDPWDIFIEDKNGKEIRVKQEPGDILLYMGCERKHWREPFENDVHAQVFLHYVDQNGPNAWCKDDITQEKPCS